MPTLDSPTTSTWPLRVRARKPQTGASVRTIRIGILGLGRVGQAVARLAADRAATAHVGLRFHVEQALVRDAEKARPCPAPGRLTTDASAFLRGSYDVVVEALDTVEPARTLVAKLLGRGTSVVTANKALVAEHGAHLESIASSRGAAFRYEATALAAVPFLGTLADRPLVASVDRVLAIVNGTSNFLLTSLAESGASFDQALAAAQALGYAEPDPSRDLDGLDAADKLVLLTGLFGWGRVSRSALDITGIRRVTADDLAAARSIGGTIKAVVSAERDAAGPPSPGLRGTGVRAFVGPVFLPVTEPLASLGGALNGIRLDGRHVANLFFSGPGAGPAVTAATLLDDAVQAASYERKIPSFARASQGRHSNQPPVFPASPVTSWFLRVSFPGVLPAAAAVAGIVSATGLPVERVADHATANSRWLCIGPQGRRDVDAAIEKLSNTHRIDAAAFGTMEPKIHFATRAIHSSQPSDPATGALIAPIYQTSTYEQESPGVNLGFDYSRTNNPTRQRLEDVLADLEGVKHCAVFASGLAAEHAVLHAYLRPHDEIVVPLDVYGGTFRLLNRVFAGFDLSIVPVDTANLDAVRAGITERTRLVWLETPTNPRLIVSDIQAIANIAHEKGALVVVDNTFATPVGQQPFSLGADIVVHSVTKYLAGHSDLIQGAALARDAAIFEPIKFLQNAIGAVPAPLDCWLTLRGLKTLELRVQRHTDNARQIAEALTSAPCVTRVYYPGLEQHPGHDVARRQMTGFGGMVSFELDGAIDDVTTFVSNRRFFTLGESLGGVRSLICHPARMTHASIPAERRAALGLADTLIRLSPGIEHPADLIEDLLSGLHEVSTARSKSIVICV